MLNGDGPRSSGFPRFDAQTDAVLGMDLNADRSDGFIMADPQRSWSVRRALAFTTLFGYSAR